MEIKSFFDDNRVKDHACLDFLKDFKNFIWFAELQLYFFKAFFGLKEIKSKIGDRNELN